MDYSERERERETEKVGGFSKTGRLAHGRTSGVADVRLHVQSPTTCECGRPLVRSRLVFEASEPDLERGSGGREVDPRTWKRNLIFVRVVGLSRGYSPVITLLLILTSP